MKTRPTRTVSLCALFIALSIVFKYALELYITESFRIGFSHIPIILASFVVGPVFGGFVGGLTDFVGYLLRPMGPYHFGFCFSNILIGVLPYVIVKGLSGFARKKNGELLMGGVFCCVYILGFVYFYLKELITPVEGVFAALLFIYLVAGYFLVRHYQNNKVLLLSTNISILYFALALTHIVTSILLNSYFLADLFGSGVLAILPLRILKTLVLIPIDTYIMVFVGDLIIKKKILNEKGEYHGSKN